MCMIDTHTFSSYKLQRQRPSLSSDTVTHSTSHPGDSPPPPLVSHWVQFQEVKAQPNIGQEKSIWLMWYMLARCQRVRTVKTSGWFTMAALGPGQMKGAICDSVYIASVCAHVHDHLGRRCRTLCCFQLSVRSKEENVTLMWSEISY